MVRSAPTDTATNILTWRSVSWGGDRQPPAPQQRSRHLSPASHISRTAPDTALRPTKVEIYDQHAAGSTVAIQALNPYSGEFETMWSGDDYVTDSTLYNAATTSVIAPDLCSPNYLTKVIRVRLNTHSTEGWHCKLQKVTGGGWRVARGTWHVARAHCQTIPMLTPKLDASPQASTRLS